MKQNLLVIAVTLPTLAHGYDSGKPAAYFGVFFLAIGILIGAAFLIRFVLAIPRSLRIKTAQAHLLAHIAKKQGASADEIHDILKHIDDGRRLPDFSE